MDEASAFMSAMAAMMVFVFVASFVVYFALLFFFGLMLYYFTGDKQPGKELLANLMRTLARLYAETWMFATSFIGFIGLAWLVKVIFGALFKDFVYAQKLLTGKFNAQQADLQLGLVLFVFAIVVFAIHWGINYMVQTNQDKRTSLMTRMFVGSGLALSSMFLFGLSLAFMLEIISYAQEGPTTYGVKPGATLATVVAAIPVWGYYLVRTMMSLRKERSE